MDCTYFSHGTTCLKKKMGHNKCSATLVATHRAGSVRGRRRQAVFYQGLVRILLTDTIGDSRRSPGVDCFQLSPPILRRFSDDMNPHCICSSEEFHLARHLIFGAFLTTRR